MSILKLKAALAVTMIGLLTISSPSYAQVTTDDRDAQGLLEQIRDYNEEIRNLDKEIRDLDKKADEFREKQTTDHYEREIKRSNSIIDSLGYWQTSKSDLNSDPTASAPGIEAFTALADSDSSRAAVHAAGEGNSSEFGINFEDGFKGNGILNTGVGTTPLVKFREALGLQDPAEIYGDDSGSHRDNLTRMYSSLYLASTVANEAHKGRIERLQVYNKLLDEARNTENLQAELRVQNAILLENGRNLALLIDLQTAQLNAQTTEISSKARSKNIPESMFGQSTTLGTTAFRTLVETLNDGYEDINN